MPLEKDFIIILRKYNLFFLNKKIKEVKEIEFINNENIYENQMIID